jgi:hypothetical protein
VEEAAIIEAISHQRVVVFRDQAASDIDLVWLLAAVWNLTYPAVESPLTKAPDLNVVSNIGRTKPPRSVVHTDTSYVQTPPALGALRAGTLPKAGGETLFSDQVVAARPNAPAPHHSGGRRRCGGASSAASVASGDGRNVALLVHLGTLLRPRWGRRRSLEAKCRHPLSSQHRTRRALSPRLALPRERYLGQPNHVTPRRAFRCGRRSNVAPRTRFE